MDYRTTSGNWLPV